MLTIREGKGAWPHTHTHTHTHTERQTDVRTAVSVYELMPIPTEPVQQEYQYGSIIITALPLHLARTSTVHTSTTTM